jgi:DNA polymerase-3 subunit alpha
MLDGAARVRPLLAEVDRLGMPAVAITDHGNVHGAFEFYQQASARGIKPVIGIEAYLAPTSRYHKQPVLWGDAAQRGDDVAGGGAYTHLTLLAEDARGLRNLFRLSSLASLEGHHYKPRMDRELLATHGAGVIATTGCPSGEVQTRLRLGQYQEALRAAADFRDIFGAENFYLELMDHGLAIERRVRADLLRIAHELQLRPLATNDAHYVHRRDAKVHEALLCVRSGTTLTDPNRFAFVFHGDSAFDGNSAFDGDSAGDSYYLASAADMRRRWDAEVPDACDTTLAVAERIGCYAEVFARQDRMPAFPVPGGHTQESWLGHQVWAGMRRRYPHGVDDERRRRVEYETGVIAARGLSSYFLVVADLVRYAKDNGIRVGPGRGSATGCLVAYALGITDLDPVEHGLLFERFLNPERAELPDIDVDFDERRRGEVIEYVRRRWGEDRVAQIVTFTTIKARAAIKDAARVLGHPFALGEKITKAMPPAVAGRDIALSAIVDPGHPRYGEAGDVRQLIASDADAAKVFDTARDLEGLVRHAGVHAAGVILSNQPLLDVVPVSRREAVGTVITQWDLSACESIGLLKMDFLGLRNLTIVEDTIANIHANLGTEVDLDSLAFDDPKTYALLASGQTLGVFQLDGGPMRSLLKSMAPATFDDIAAVLAL